MAEAPARERYTFDDYCRLPEGDRRELIEGAFHLTPAPNEKHQRLVGNLYILLRTHLDREQTGRVYLSPFDVILDRHNTVQPDLVVVLNRNLSRLHPEGLRGAPDMVVEVLSPRNQEHDRVHKRELYGRFGVEEYWLVDPQIDQLEILDRDGRLLAGGRAGQQVSSPLLGCSFAVDPIFR